MKIEDLSKMTDAELGAYAGSGQEAYQIVSVEVARRLRLAVDDFSLVTKRHTVVMIGLTGVIALFTICSS